MDLKFSSEQVLYRLLCFLPIACNRNSTKLTSAGTEVPGTWPGQLSPSTPSTPDRGGSTRCDGEEHGLYEVDTP